jgi:hypothetical protein
MARYSVESRRSGKEVLAQAVAYFGPGGLGLETKEQDTCLVRFEGGGGHVLVTVSARDKGTTVDLETREWDYHVRRFMATLK